MVFLTAGDVVVATLTLSVKACGDASLGVSVFNEIEPDRNAIGGKIAKVSVRNGNGVEKLSGSVIIKGGKGDLEVKAVDVAPGQTVRAPSVRYTAPF